MSTASIQLDPLQRAVSTLAEALDFWHATSEASPLKPHLRSAVLQSFEFSYELSVRTLKRVLVERAATADEVMELSFNDLLRRAAGAGYVPDALGWRRWREMRNLTSHAYDAELAQRVALAAGEFLVDARALIAALADAASPESAP
ncbi:MAG: hypothetical protein RLZZ524_3244 [Pseudomonadota bacterium]|jgi:nucleotidyltransferase substrate binding protein (TIGR01987 family)